MAKLMGVWGFIIAGILFLLASLMPVFRGEALNTTLLILAIAFLLLGTITVRNAKKAG